MVEVTQDSAPPRHVTYAASPDEARHAARIALMDCGFTAESLDVWRCDLVDLVSRGNSPGRRGGCSYIAECSVTSTASGTVVRLDVTQDRPRDYSTGRPVPVEVGAKVDRSAITIAPAFYARLDAVLALPKEQAIVSGDPDSKDPIIAFEEPPAMILDRLEEVLAERGFEVRLNDHAAGLLVAARNAYAPAFSWDSLHWKSTSIVTVLARATAAGTLARIKTSNHGMPTRVPEFARQLEDRVRPGLERQGRR